ncbi:hypothetical protein, partial [Pseudomonas agarici]|uniref:hypothetical protein n=1 Tax=Pseudomonas agarici TaxID=46677 RepID=UPI001C42ECF3
LCIISSRRYLYVLHKKPGREPGFFVPAIWLSFTFQALIRLCSRWVVGSSEWLNCPRHRLRSCSCNDVAFNQLLDELLRCDSLLGGCLLKEMDVIDIRDLPQ